MIPRGRDFIFHDKLSIHGKIEYEVDYLLNSKKFRKIPTKCTNCLKHNILIGDSYVFGQGLKDEETLSSVLESKSRDVQVYNWGNRGYSITDFAFELQGLPLDEVLQTEGKMQIIFQDFHFHRILYGSNQFQFFNPKINAYRLEEGKLTKIGILKSYIVRLEYLMISYWFKFLSKFDKNILSGSKALTSEQLDRSIEISIYSLNLIKSEYLKMFPSGKFSVFIIAIDNSYVVSRALLRMKESGLDASIINVNEWSKKFSELTYRDGHPKFEYNDILSRYLE
jgi:hypothetical protein